MNAAKLIITVAPTGARVTRDDHPRVPLTPGEIVEAVVQSAREGASIAHIHARDLKGEPSHNPDTFREIRERVAEQSDIIVQFSTGTRGIGKEDLIRLVSLRPESASFSLQSFANDKTASGIPADVAFLHDLMVAYGVQPEWEVDSLAKLAGALRLTVRPGARSPHCVGLVLRDPQSMLEAAELIVTIARALPPSAIWSLAKGGRFYKECRYLAVALGGHVRCGFEDTVRRADGTLYQDNAEMVAEVAAIGRSLGREPASPTEVRHWLGLPRRGDR